ncbi:MAG: hypothetical protein NT172_08040 [Planctomycetota bacterium]|nr:hypothetical protein [Planctomycetota bacterium]
MTLKGFIQSAELVEDSSGPDRVMMIVRVQGVGPGQPRKILVPFEILVEQDELDAETMAGRAFRAECTGVENAMGLVNAIEVGPARVLRNP